MTCDENVVPVSIKQIAGTRAVDEPIITAIAAGPFDAKVSAAGVKGVIAWASMQFVTAWTAEHPVRAWTGV